MNRSLIFLLVLGAACGLLPASGGCNRRVGPAPTTDPAQPGPAAPHPPERDWFEDRTTGSGVEFAYRNGEESNLYTILESLGGGVALFDFDGDGLLDIFLTGGGHFEGTNPPRIEGYPNRLYKNLGGWKFRDVTSEVGLDQPVFYSHGVAVGDIDRDGWPDLFVTGYGRAALYANRSADPANPQSPRRVFREVTREAGLPENLTWSTSAAFADLDGDGYPELFVCQYLDWSFAAHRICPHDNIARDVCTPHEFRPLQPRLFRNSADGRFTEVTDQHKLRADGKGLGVLIADLDGDGRPDIYVANDASDNHLYLNRAGFRLEECGLARGVAVDEFAHSNGSMGIAIGDWDRSGLPSLLVTNYQGEWHALYQNLGKGQFGYRSQSAGLARLGQSFVGFGTAFADFDGDGWLDLAIANGHVLRHPVGSTLDQLPVLMRNVSDENRRKLVNIAPEAGPYFRATHRGRGLAVGDLDNDGWPDLVIAHQNVPAVLLRNRTAGIPENSNHWVGFSLRSKKNRSMVGTEVTLHSGNTTQTRFVAAGGYLTESDSRLQFGLGQSGTIDRITVRWPYGPTQTWKAPAADRYWVVREDSRELE